MNINIEHNVQMCMVHSEGGVYHVNILANADLPTCNCNLLATQYHNDNGNQNYISP